MNVTFILTPFLADNCGCGIWVLDGSHPLIHSNRVLRSGDSGIAFVNMSDNEHDNQPLNLQFMDQDVQVSDTLESSKFQTNPKRNTCFFISIRFSI